MRARSAAPATSPTTRSRRSRSSPCGCSGRCCSRASPAPARPRSPRRWPRRSALTLIRLQCYEGIDASQALYDWDFPRQILHLRAARGGRRRRGELDVERGREVAVRRAVPARPTGAAGAARAPACCWSTRSTAPTTSSRRSCSRCCRRSRSRIPELGTVARRHARRSSCSPPTAPASCTTRSSAAASTTGWSTPAWSREVEIVRTRLPEVTPRLAAQVAAVVQRLRAARPAQAARASPRRLDWARALRGSARTRARPRERRPRRSAPS